ncbi:glycosyltransferase family 2 protein [Candidatus Thiosymbion oneisti]|uniref:glycosyltransferase family 2 protein n=1 Tax=Candidatus Thiosymbion oneisti TaxID=589554 RepID=UPI000B7C9F3C|nr:glycosyltransferase family 2 protein [Candidatus Thiosymbion oneisti]
MNAPDTQILVSILTPTWNRASYIRRVWESLKSQTCKNFEWIIADDGSTDDTEKVVRELSNHSDFPIVLIRADSHVGKAFMDNQAVVQAQGEFILWSDSDDYLAPNALERLLDTWFSIPPDVRDDYVGVTALCATDEGVVVNPFPDVEQTDVSWNDLAGMHKVTRDMLFFTRASALKACPFPEVDLVIPESVVWTQIGHRKTRLISEVLMIKEYKADNRISFTGCMAYNRGRAYALATTERNLRSYTRGWRIRAWHLITFLRYSIHGELAMREVLRLWGNNTSRFALWASLPVAWLLAIKDMRQGKVKKTHREFLAVRNTVQTYVVRLGKA